MNQMQSAHGWRERKVPYFSIQQPVNEDLIVARADSVSVFPVSGPVRDRASQKLRKLAASTPEPPLIYRTLVALYEHTRP